MSAVARCLDCGWQSKRTSPAHARRIGPVHSCDLHRQRVARAERVARNRAASGPVRSCTHKRADHQHGTCAAYVRDHCRCRSCRDARAVAGRHRARERAYGRWEPYVDAEPARAHVATLRAQGVGWKRVAHLAGIAESTVWKFVYGDPQRGQQPSKRVRPATAQAILAVRADLAGGAFVDATGTRRRMQALVAVGWSCSAVGRAMGQNPSNFLTMLDRCQVTAATARRAATVYEQMWNVAPPSGTHIHRGHITRARNYAAVRGWLPPLAWDDTDLDDPAAEPAAQAEPAVDEVAVERALRTERVRLTREERFEVARRILARGGTVYEICGALHMNTERVRRLVSQVETELAATVIPLAHRDDVQREQPS